MGDTLVGRLGRFASDPTYYPLGLGRVSRYAQDLLRTVPSMGYKAGYGLAQFPSRPVKRSRRQDSGLSRTLSIPLPHARSTAPARLRR